MMSGCGFGPNGWPGTFWAEAIAAQKPFGPGVFGEKRAAETLLYWWSAVQRADDDLHPGRILGPYELLVPVGSGGMASVWAARHRGTGAIHALKMLQPELAENAAFRDMFFDEARIASRIRHENVCETFELVELDGHLIIVMEWINGASLAHVLRPGPPDMEDPPRVPLPVRHAAKILSETCAGLHAAHELTDERGRPLSVVHRDVSPHNILLTLDGRVKVTDFGVAKAMGRLQVTLAGQLKGKLGYMSPEQLVGGGLDRRSDVFSLGIVLYELTTGKKPFSGDNDPQIMAAIISGVFDPPSALVPGYPPGLEKIVLRAMASAPEARFATALQLRRALEGWLSTSGPPIGKQEIALLLHERCREEIEARAAGVMSLPLPPPPSSHAAWSAPQQPASPDLMPSLAPTSDSGPGAMETHRRSRPREVREGMSLVSGIAAVLVGLVIGLAVLSWVRAARKERAAAVLAGTTKDEAGVLLAATTVDAGEVDDGRPALFLGDLDDEEPNSSSDRITLTVPDGARLFVNGEPLPADQKWIARPDAGSVVVLVRAEGRLDTTVTVDPTSDDTIEVTMKKKPRAVTPVATIEMPPNPYE
jgi:serine/threonine-protein kinase